MPILLVKAKPNARVACLTQQDDGTWLAQLKALPVDGKANAELIALVANHFGCSRILVTPFSSANQSQTPSLAFSIVSASPVARSTRLTEG